LEIGSHGVRETLWYNGKRETVVERRSSRLSLQAGRGYQLCQRLPGRRWQRDGASRGIPAEIQTSATS